MTEEPTVVCLPGDIRVAIIEPEHIQRSWLKGRYYEHGMLSYIKGLNLDGTFIDGGACIGNHALYFARFCAQQVIAIEPVERNMAHMQTNLVLSGLRDRVTPVQAALSDKAGRGSMKQAGNNHGTYELVSGDDVEVTTLDNLAVLAKFPVTLVKLDIQGCELQALEGARWLLHHFRPLLFIELIDSEELAGADHFLAGFGYERTMRFNQSPTYKYEVKK